MSAANEICNGTGREGWSRNDRECGATGDRATSARGRVVWMVLGGINPPRGDRLRTEEGWRVSAGARLWTPDGSGVSYDGTV